MLVSRSSSSGPDNAGLGALVGCGLEVASLGAAIAAYVLAVCMVRDGTEVVLCPGVCWASFALSCHSSSYYLCYCIISIIVLSIIVIMMKIIVICRILIIVCCCCRWWHGCDLWREYC